MATSPDTTNYFNNFYSTGPGLGNVSSYLVSGTPWVTGSTIADTKEQRIDFPAVTQTITIWNRSALVGTSLFVHFDSIADSADGDDVIGEHHYITLTGSNGMMTATSQATVNVKCDHIFISHGSPGATANNADYELFATLTGIAPSQMFELTGSGINALT